MKTRNSLTRRGFMTSAALGAAAVGVGLPSSLSAAAYGTAVAASEREPLRLHRNESPYGLAPAAAEAVKGAVDSKSSRYPIEEPKVLEEVIAKRFGVEKENVLLGYGSIEVLKMATESFCNAGHPAVVAEPTYEAVVNFCPFVHARPIKIKLNAEQKHDLPRMLHASRGAGMIFLCNPSNPAGTYVDKTETEGFVRKLPRGVVLISDEAYFDYADAPDYESCLRYVKEGLPVVVSRTFSKIYGMAGIRVGYALGRKDLIARMAKRRLANNPNQLAVAAAMAALKNDGEFVARVKKMNSEVRDYVSHEVSALGFKPIPSQANFVMIAINRPAQPVIDELKKRNVLVGRLFPSMPDHVRVSFGTMAEMKTFVQEFKEVMSAPYAAGSGTSRAK
ncbi:MAG TPA: aminotransferase class I/II-fold pyridoxal phosphate-dependent enzyme [Blastocatellia bacterium]|nr:aminotransferase class I/II-fold pyridoxal phosphate-dependent enzyme [Blastocatellia bacterium]